MNKKYDLVLVMPVYNEAECIINVVEGWHEVLLRLGIYFKMLVINDGSTDSTAKYLDIYKDWENIEVYIPPCLTHR